MRILHFLAALILIQCQIESFAQVKPANNVGMAKGFVRDSIYNHGLNAATVSVYTYPEGKLVTYQVTNKFGEFALNNLPLTTNLNLILSHVGYSQVNKRFTVDKETKVVDLKIIYATLEATNLKEVKITVPPVQMNGDTLEFNAIAFKLDTNAVVEDLMKKIPNITMWGDGTITVNGREIKSLLVNGKEFMGGDPVIATQNIPKNAVEKIQVYNVADNTINPLDSILHMNLKLKKGKDIGHFGKLGGGYGTNSRFETDANFNIFSSNLQLAIVGASNNINKIAPNINTLQRSSTFKGVGVKVDYMSDFRTIGINQPNTGGYTFRYDFKKINPIDQRRSFLTSDYFLQNKNASQLSRSQTTTSVSNNQNIIENNNFQINGNNTSQRFNTGYQLSNSKYAINLSQNINIGTNNSASESQTASSDNNFELLSKSSTINKSQESNKSYGLKINFSLLPSLLQKEMRLSGLQVDYDLEINERDDNNTNLTNFESIANPSKSKRYNREYANSLTRINQRINFILPGLLKLIGAEGFQAFDIDFKNYLQISNDRARNNVYDFDEVQSKLIANKYLTNAANYKIFVYEPALTIHKGIERRLTHRFDRSLRFSFDLKAQLYYQNNESQKSFQRIDRIYRNLLPAASVSFSDNQYGEYRNNLTVGYDSNTDIPSIGELAPLTDSANVYYVRTINLNLKESKWQAINIKFDHKNEKKNSFGYKLAASVSKKNNNIIDSLLIDAQNVRTVYKVNNSNNTLFGLSGNLNKAIKLKNAEVQINYTSQYDYEKNPYIIKGLEGTVMSNHFNNSFLINYTYKSSIAVEAKQNVLNSESKQPQANRGTFKNQDLSTSFSVSYNATKKLKINSNISFASSSSSGLSDINYNIWNASTTYRLLKGNNLELKLSGLDLLGQNTSIINRNRGGSITLGTQMVLQQYFMFGLSYYPRKFGKDVKK